MSRNARQNDRHTTTATEAPHANAKNPQIFFWGNPDWNFNSVADIGKSDATVLVFQGSLAVQRMTSQGIVGNGTDGVYGSYDTARVQSLIDDYGPVFAQRGKAPKAGLQPSDLFTNEFLDKSKKL